MKKVLCLLLSFVLCVSLFTLGVSAKEKELPLSDIKFKSGVTVDSEIKWLERGYYFGYENVDLSGINSVKITAYNKLVTGTNGVTMAIVTDDPKTGDVIGYVTLTEVGENVNVTSSIKPTEGIHNLYFYNHLMEQIRDHIEQGTFKAFKKEKVELYDQKI